MANKKEILLLFTSAFPFGKGEQFIETEIQFLSRQFREIHIYPLDKSGPRRNLPANVSVKDFSLFLPYSRGKMMAKHGFKIAGLFSKQFSRSAHRSNYFFRFRYHLNYLMHRLAEAERLGPALQQYDPGKTVVYTYWFNVWTTVLLLARRLGFFPMKIITRAHGGDLDEQQRKDGYFPFRSLEMQLVDRVFTVSDYGKNLLLERYPSHAKKIQTARLGVSDHGINPPNSSDEFHVVTCSFVYGLKRLHLVVDILSKMNLKIRWTHFGEGELLEDLRRRASQLPPNVRSEFHGLTANEEILRFYGNVPVDLFMNVSELEGIPVSIMEAISFGIPVTGCKICGVPEIVTEETGFLLEKDFDPAEVAQRVAAYLTSTAVAKTKFREGVKMFWRKNYNSEINYTSFASMLSSLE